MRQARSMAMIVGGVLALALPVGAQQTREQVKADRDEFLRTHTFDNSCECWVLKSGVQPPPGIKSREEVKAERDKFISGHVFSNTCDCWRPLSGPPRNLSTMTREQRKAATEAFTRTHEWDNATDSWVPRKVAQPRK